jgi:hypothetical protein
MISISNYKLGFRNKQLIIIETKNKSKQNLRLRMERSEIRINRLETLTQELIKNSNYLLNEFTITMNS